MKIILLTTSYPLTKDSSSGIFVKRLADALSNLLSVTILTPSHRDITKVISTADGPDIHAFRYSLKRFERLAQEAGGIPVLLKNKPLYYLVVPFFLLAMARAVNKETKLNKIAFIHANWSICGLIACLIGKYRDVPVLTTLRGEDFTRASKSTIDKKILDYAVLHSAKVTVVSQEMLTMMSNAYPDHRDKIHWVPNGVSMESNSTHNRDNAPADSDDTLKLLTVGSLIKRKRISDILQALRNSSSNIELTIIGSGPEEQQLKSLADDLPSSIRVYFKGSVAPDEVAEFYSTSDVFILASESEGRPNVLLESMASGLPIISTDISGARELVNNGRSGELYPVGDTKKLAELIMLFDKDNVARRSYAENGRSYIEEQGLTWENSAANYMALYQQVIAEQHHE